MGDRIYVVLCQDQWEKFCWIDSAWTAEQDARDAAERINTGVDISGRPLRFNTATVEDVELGG